MSHYWSTKFCVASVAIIAFAQAAAQQTSAKALAQLLVSDRCSLASVDHHLWRAAGASDYTGSGWDAWTRVTKSQSPWFTLGDFDGDGIEDRAMVIVNETENMWRMAVIFGTKSDAPCRSHQISQGSLVYDGQRTIAGVMTFPTAKTTVVCHHVAERGNAICKLDVTGASSGSNLDAVLTFNSAPTYVKAYVWRGVARGSPLAGPNVKYLPAGASRDDGIWIFAGQTVTPEIDFKSLQ